MARKKTSLSLEETLWEATQIAAVKRKVTGADIVEDALREWLKKDPAIEIKPIERKPDPDPRIEAFKIWLKETEPRGSDRLAQSRDASLKASLKVFLDALAEESKK